MALKELSLSYQALIKGNKCTYKFCAMVIQRVLQEKLDTVTCIYGGNQVNAFVFHYSAFASCVFGGVFVHTENCAVCAKPIPKPFTACLLDFARH